MKTENVKNGANNERSPTTHGGIEGAEHALSWIEQARRTIGVQAPVALTQAETTPDFDKVPPNTWFMVHPDWSLDLLAFKANKGRSTVFIDPVSPHAGALMTKLAALGGTSRHRIVLLGFLDGTFRFTSVAVEPALGQVLDAVSNAKFQTFLGAKEAWSSMVWDAALTKHIVRTGRGLPALEGKQGPNWSAVEVINAQFIVAIQPLLVRDFENPIMKNLLLGEA